MANNIHDRQIKDINSAPAFSIACEESCDVTDIEQTALQCSSDVESCAFVNQGTNTRGQLGKWRHGSCGSSLPYMCERSPDDCPEGRQCSLKDFGYDRVETSSCDPGEYLFNVSCYHFTWYAYYWNEAENLCKTRKSHLPSVHSEDEIKFLTSHIRDNHCSWVGLRDKAKNFKFTDGTSTADTPGLQLLDDTECVGVYFDRGHLSSYSCTANRFLTICQKAKVREAVSAHSSSIFRPGWSKKCGRWMDNPSNDFCYLMSRNHAVTWQKARDKCVNHGGDLLSIADDTEQNFIRAMYGTVVTSPTLWLGANANITEGSKWTDGSPLTYKNLTADNAFDAAGGRCLYFVTHNGGWKFHHCQQNSSYICKRRGRSNVTLGRFALMLSNAKI